MKKFKNLNSNTIIIASSLESLKDKIEQSALIPRIKLVMEDNSLLLKPSSILSNWGDPILIMETQSETEFKVVPKKKILSPDLNYYKNANNIKEIIGLVNS